MEKVYTICMIIGFVIPLIMFLMGSVLHVFNEFGDVLEGISDGFDFSFEIGDTCVSFLPLSVHSICAALLVFGTVGKMMFHGNNLILTNVAAAAGGYLAAVGIQTFINRLKKVDHSTYSTEQLLLFDAKVVNTIIPGGFGSISITTPDGNTRTYPAKCIDSSVRIGSSAKVVIDHFEQNVAFVREELPFYQYKENMEEGGKSQKKEQKEIGSQK